MWTNWFSFLPCFNKKPINFHFDVQFLQHTVQVHVVYNQEQKWLKLAIFFDDDILSFTYTNEGNLTRHRIEWCIRQAMERGDAEIWKTQETTISEKKFIQFIQKQLMILKKE